MLDAVVWIQAVGRIGGFGVLVTLVLLATSTPAAAAPKSITGKLTKPGYTVVALAATGKAGVARASRGRFKLRPPAKRVTLHLRAPNGKYAGPIVIGRNKRGRRATLGVKAGARLGRIKVRRGYAKLSKRLAKKWVDTKHRARARKGVPIGARNVGRVRSRPLRSAVLGDPDLDGIPDPLDIDDDGDLILDYSDRPSGARAAQEAPPPQTFGVLSKLELGLGHTRNANPRSSTGGPAFGDGEINTALKSFGGLIFGPAGGPGPGLSELDCAGDPNADPPRPGLTYCSNPNSTGSAYLPGPPPPPGVPRSTAPFPGDPGGVFDSDGDGFGTIAPFTGLPNLLHGATIADIRTDDQLIELKNDANGAETGDAFTTTLQYVFATVPALDSYDDDGPGRTGPKTLSYPYPPGLANELPVAPCPTGALPPCVEGDVVLTLTFWRPQRRRIDNDPPIGSGDSANWTDVGGEVGYGAGAGGGPCPQEAFSNPRSEPIDGLLIPAPAPPPGIRAVAAFRDQAPDRPANPNNKLTYTLNLTQCLRSNGAESSFDQSGEVVAFSLVASGRGGRGDQGLSFKRQ